MTTNLTHVCLYCNKPIPRKPNQTIWSWNCTCYHRPCHKKVKAMQERIRSKRRRQLQGRGVVDIGGAALEVLNDIDQVFGNVYDGGFADWFDWLWEQWKEGVFPYGLGKTRTRLTKEELECEKQKYTKRY